MKIVSKEAYPDSNTVWAEFGWVWLTLGSSGLILALFFFPHFSPGVGRYQATHRHSNWIW